MTRKQASKTDHQPVHPALIHVKQVQVKFHMPPLYEDHSFPFHLSDTQMTWRLL